jgi:hypothetical protein
MPSRVFNIIRYSYRANRLFSHYLFVMRSCRFCISRDFFYVISNLSKYCEQCFRSKRFCELASPDAEIERLLRQKRKLFDKAMEIKIKVTRFIKQHKLIIQKFREFDRREK